MKSHIHVSTAATTPGSLERQRESGMTIATTDTAPRIWVACLHCYNSGRLVGEWFDAPEAESIDLAAVHAGSGSLSVGCEELWVMDHENIPVPGEMGLAEAAEWGEVYEEVSETL